jgi:hypothetical protein
LDCCKPYERDLEKFKKHLERVLKGKSRINVKKHEKAFGMDLTKLLAQLK